MNKFYTRSLDIVAAFLIGRDRGAAQGKPVYVRAPIEWWDLFLEWLEEVNPSDRQWYKDRFKEMCFRLDGNLYGRRTAGSVYRNELEEIVCSRGRPAAVCFCQGSERSVHFPVHQDWHCTAAPCGRHPRSRTFRGPSASLRTRTTATLRSASGRTRKGGNGSGIPGTHQSAQ